MIFFGVRDSYILGNLWSSHATTSGAKQQYAVCEDFFSVSSGVGADEAKVQDVGSDEYLLKLIHAWLV